MDEHSYVTLTSAAHWSVAAVTFVLVAICVLLHYGALSQLNRRLSKPSDVPHRKVLLVIVIVLLVHILEIWMFAFAYFALLREEGYGTLEGSEEIRLFDCTYFSASTYTTVGYGDLVVTGPLRLLAGMEALLGLVLITWSASFTYLEMSRFWRQS